MIGVAIVVVVAGVGDVASGGAWVWSSFDPTWP